MIAITIRFGIPCAFVWLLLAASGWNDGLLRSLAATFDMPSIANHPLLWGVAMALAWPSVAAVRRLIGEGGTLYSPITRALGNRLALLARELGAICREVEKSGYDGPTIAERLSDLQKRGLVFNSMAYGLLRLPPVPGEKKFRPQWEEARHPRSCAD
jgi:hypothetical protein